MSYVTLEEAKAQVSVEDDDSHDTRLLRLIPAAESWARNFLNVDSLDDLDEESPPASPVELPEDVKSGILLHVELEFDRDEKNFELLLKRAEQLLWPYRRNLGV